MSPFRELFVELGEQAVLAIEAMVKQQEPTPAPSPNPRIPILVDWTVICNFFGWTSAHMQVNSACDAGVVVAMMDCGHRMSFQIRRIELARCRGARDEFDLLCRKHDEAKRECCCMRRLTGTAS